MYNARVKKSIITIRGLQGSGKSATAKRVAATLGYTHFSSGDFLRKIGSARGMSIEESRKASETDPSMDREIDALLEKMGREQNNLVIDSRLAYHWIPDGFHVFLDLDHHTAASRIFQDIQTQGREGQSAATIEEVEQKSAERYQSDIARYKTLYNLNPFVPTANDLIIDTRVHDLDHVVEIILKKYKEWQDS